MFPSGEWSARNRNGEAFLQGSQQYVAVPQQQQYTQYAAAPQTQYVAQQPVSVARYRLEGEGEGEGEVEGKRGGGTVSHGELDKCHAAHRVL